MFSRGRAAFGFTLAELLISLALVTVLTAVALPMYRSYSVKADVGLIQDNIRSIHLLQVERRISFGDYVSGNWLPGGSRSLTTRLGWNPGSGRGRVAYVVTCETDGGMAGECERGSGYTVTATHEDRPGNPVVMQFQ